MKTINELLAADLKGPAEMSAFLIARTLDTLCMLDNNHLPRGLKSDLIGRVRLESGEVADAMERAHRVMLEDYEGAHGQLVEAANLWQLEYGHLITED